MNQRNLVFSASVKRLRRQRNNNTTGFPVFILREIHFLLQNLDVLLPILSLYICPDLALLNMFFTMPRNMSAKYDYLSLPNALPNGNLF